MKFASLTFHADIEVVEEPGYGDVVSVVDLPLRKRAEISSRCMFSTMSPRASSAPTQEAAGHFSAGEF